MEEEEIPSPVDGEEVPEVPVDVEIAVEVETAVVESTVDPESTTEAIEADVVVNEEESGVEGVIDGYVVFSFPIVVFLYSFNLLISFYYIYILLSQ